MESKGRGELIELGVKILAVLGAGIWAVFLFVVLPQGRTELIELGLKVVAVVGAGIWAVFLLLVLRKRELAEADLRKREAEIRLAQADSLKREADIRDLEFRAKLATAELGLKTKQTDAQLRDLEIKAKQQSAELELTVKQADAQIRKLELEEKQQTVVTVDIQPTVSRSLDGDGYIISAVVELSNHGTRNTRINWRDEPPAFSVRLAKFGAGGKADYDPPIMFRVMQTRDPAAEAVSHVVRAGATESIPFLIRVSLAGVYLLSFRGAVDQQTRDEGAAVGAVLPAAWTAKKYVFVGDTPVPSALGATDAQPVMTEEDDNLITKALSYPSGPTPTRVTS